MKPYRKLLLADVKFASLLPFSSLSHCPRSLFLIFVILPFSYILSICRQSSELNEPLSSTELLLLCRVRYVSEMKDFMGTPEWQSFMVNDAAKSLVEEKVKNAKPYK